MRVPCLILLIVSSAWVLAPVPLLADGHPEKPLETGAVELREVLRGAIRADAQRYPFGEIECVITRQNIEGPTNREVSHIQSWWLDDKSFAIVHNTKTFDPSFIRSRMPIRGVQTMEDSFEQTVSSGKILLINRDRKRAFIALLSAREKQPNTAVSPADFWFGRLDGQGEHLDWALGPSATPRWDPIKQYDARPLLGDRLEITARFADEGAFYRIVASLRHCKILSFDGNYHFKGREPETTSWTYTWHASGTLLVKLVRRVKTGDSPTREVVYEVKRVDLTRRPADERLSIDESKIPAGYFIDNTITKRRYWQGNVNGDLKKLPDEVSRKPRSARLLTR